MVIAWSLQLIVQIPSLKKFGVRYRPNFRFRDQNIKQALLLAGPMLISTWVQPLYSIINSRLASGIDGAVSTLEYGNRLYTIVVGVFSFVVTNLIFPKLARANAEDDKEAANGLIVSSFKAILLVIIPLMFGFMILARPITVIIYQHGDFTTDDTAMVSAVLTCYSVGMIGLAVNEVLSKSFFSMNDSKTPMRNSVLSMIVNIILAYVLFSVLGTNGLALAAAGGSIFNGGMNLVCMVRKNPGMFKRRDLLEIAKGAAAALVMGIAVWSMYNQLQPVFDEGMIMNILLAAICAGAGVVIYGVCCLLFRVEMITGLFKGRKD